MKIINIKHNKNNIVKKHNSLIKAKGKLSTTAQKMLLMLISMIKKEDKNFHEYAININDYKKNINSTNKEYNFYLQAALELIENPFEVTKGIWFNWCNMVDIKSMPGYIIFTIHPKLKPYLLSLKNNFTTYNLVNVLNLKSKYSIKIYELFIKKYNTVKNYKTKQQKITFNIEIEELKDFLKIPKSYNYAMFKKQAILKAQEDLLKYTNIRFTFTEIKRSRKIHSLDISLIRNNKGSNDYLKNIHNFKTYIRRKYKPNKIYFPSILEIEDKDLNEYFKIGVDYKGLLYISTPGNTKTLNKKEAAKWWNDLYEMALEGKLSLND